MIHEAVHKYAVDELLHQSQPLNEGTTEYFTRLVSTGAGVNTAARANYEENYDTVTQLVGLVGEATVASAFFDGDVDGLRTAFIQKKSEADWDAFLKATKETRWADAQTFLTP